jgi:hypothetical protein
MASQVGGATAAMALGSRRVTRIVIGTQAIVGLTYFVSAGALTVAAGRERPDPMGLLPDLGGVELLLYLLVFLSIVLGAAMGGLLSLAGLVLLVNVPAWREHTRLMWTLAAFTALSLAYLTVSVTPFGTSLQQWLL